MFKFLNTVIIFMAATILMAQPKLEIEGGDTYDWGRVKPDDSPLKATIKIWNKGDQLLKIERVKPGCGCTTAPLDKDEIEPGQFATLDVSLNVGSRTGSLIKGITITSNDPAEKHKRLRLKAEVNTPYKLFPRYLSFGSLEVGKEAVAKLVFTNNTDKPMKIVDFNFEPSKMDLNIEKGTIIEPQSDFTIIAKYTPKITGTLRANLNIITDHPDAKAVQIQGWGRIRPEAEVEGSK